MTGVVRDSTGRALNGAEVLLEGSTRQTRTDSGGRYTLTASGGNYVALFRSLGYQPLRQPARLAASDTLRLDATLAFGPPQELAAVDVKGRRRRGVGIDGFEERRALGFGKFIDSTVLRRSEGRRLSELLRQSGVRMVSTPGGRAYFAANPTKNNPDGTPSCYMSVFLDGVAYYRTGSNMRPPDMSREFMIMSLEAIEVYRSSAQIPMEFAGRGSDCGVIVLWTRRGK